MYIILLFYCSVSLSSIFLLILTLSQVTNYRLFQTKKNLQSTISNLIKIQIPRNDLKTLWETEKLLVTISPCFPVKRFLLQTCKNQDLLGKGLIKMYNHLIQHFYDKIKFLDLTKLTLYQMTKF